MVACNEGAHFAASHLEIFAGRVEVGTNAADFGVHILQIIGASLGGEFRVDAGVEGTQLGCSFLNGLRGFRARFLELTLSNLELVSDDFEVALQISVGLFVLNDAIFQGAHVLLDALLERVDLCCDSLLSCIEF